MDEEMHQRKVKELEMGISSCTLVRRAWSTTDGSDIEVNVTTDGIILRDVVTADGDSNVDHEGFGKKYLPAC